MRPLGISEHVHVDDVARANVTALLGAPPPGFAYNIASGQPRSIGELASTMVAPLGGSSPPVVTGKYRLGDVRHVVASPARARQELGFHAEIGFADGIRELAGEL